MTFRAFPRLFVPAITAFGLSSACSSAPPPAQAYVTTEIGSGGGAVCNTMGTTFSLGSATPNETVSRATGSGPIAIDCSVAASGSNYNLAIDVTNSTMVVGQGGALSIQGTVNGTTGGTGINASLNAGGVDYTESDCTIAFTFTLSNGLPPLPPSVESGRVWGHLDCPMASAAESGQTSTCHVQADFVFENCKE
jgi:hypothetical protein